MVNYNLVFLSLVLFFVVGFASAYEGSENGATNSYDAISQIETLLADYLLSESVDERCYDVDRNGVVDDVDVKIFTHYISAGYSAEDIFKIVTIISSADMLVSEFDRPISEDSHISLKHYSNDEIKTNLELQTLIAGIPATNPKLLNSYKNNPDVFVTFGEIPALDAGIDAYNYFVSLRTVENNLYADKALHQYFYPDGPMYSYGVMGNNYFYVTFSESGLISNSLVNEIYKIIDLYAIEESIENIPVVCIVDGSQIKVDVQTNSLDVAGATKDDFWYFWYATRNIAAGGYGISTKWNNSTTYQTAGFPAEYGNQTGIVTCSHPHYASGFDYYLNYTQYTPFGTSTLYNSTDAIFIPMNDNFSVFPEINPLNGSDYVKISGSYDCGWSGMELRKSGINTSYTVGTYFGSGTWMDLQVEYTTNGHGRGDSGAPVYNYNPSLDKYKIVGVHVGYYNMPIPGLSVIYHKNLSVYIPYHIIHDELGVSVLTSYTYTENDIDIVLDYLLNGGAIPMNKYDMDKNGIIDGRDLILIQRRVYGG